MKVSRRLMACVFRIPNGLCDYRWWRRCTKQITNYASLPPNGDDFFDAFISSFNCSGGSLERYRWVHSLYLFDPRFRAARQNHPFITVVDDHDTDDESDVFEDSLRAFLEYVPTRTIQRPDNKGQWPPCPSGCMANMLYAKWTSIDTLQLVGT